ncbi:MAG: HAMP domain-containing sensor histidine kinase [Eubacteriales bacterium]|nr:HAMP domain-containing sensor histidine kinase [Eubacteriales bacterium]
MKSYRRLCAVVITILLVVTAVVNVRLYRMSNSDEARPYMVEIFRLVEEMKTTAGISDISSCQYVKNIVLCEDVESITETSGHDNVIREINGKLYRFEYDSHNAMVNQVAVTMNVVLAFIFVFVIIFMTYIGRKIILPFNRMEEVPFELSKGNLALELPEEKTKFFGRFIWGTNMLRENLEEKRQKELAMHKDKKMLLLSLTHDIKTPLSVIKLNAQALSKGLYKDEERRNRAANEINDKVVEIEQYVTDIIAASREDFLDLSVREEEFYLSNVVNKIEDYYKLKMSVNKTQFVIDSYSDVMLLGDESRVNEVLQNLIENAIKYGDGQEIQMSFSREEECQLITIRNTGDGISQDEILKIFDSFFRGSNVGKQPGNGLGLYICRHLMNNMNGDIFVKQDEKEFAVTIVVRMV